MLRKIGWLCLLFLLVSGIAAAQEAGTPLSQAVSTQNLEQAGKESIVDRLGGGDGYVIAAAYLPPDDIKVPEGTITLKSEIPYGIRLNAPTIVNIVIYIDDQPYRNIGLRFTVRKFANVLLASRDLAVHETLGPECVRIEKRNVARLVPGYIQNVSQVQGLVTRQMVREGTVLTEGMVAKPVIIKRGSLLTLVARIGSIKVAVTGQALQDGAVGQSIRIQNLISEKIVVAQVLDANSAQVVTYNGR